MFLKLILLSSRCWAGVCYCVGEMVIIFITWSSRQSFCWINKAGWSTLALTEVLRLGDRVNFLSATSVFSPISSYPSSNISPYNCPYNSLLFINRSSILTLSLCCSIGYSPGASPSVSPTVLTSSVFILNWLGENASYYWSYFNVK